MKPFIYFAFVVLKFDKSNASKLLQNETNCEKSSTNVVSKLDKSIEVKA